jgi:hypothetical protein
MRNLGGTLLMAAVDSPAPMQIGPSVSVVRDERDFVTCSELVYASTLTYASTLKRGFIQANPHHCHADFYTFLPSHHLFAIKDSGEIVGTVSLIVDSAAGIPSDHVVPDFNRLLRAENKVLCELRGLTATGPQDIAQKRMEKLLSSVFLFAARAARCERINLLILDKDRDFLETFLRGLKADFSLRKYHDIEWQLLTIHLESIYAQKPWWDKPWGEKSQSTPEPLAQGRFRLWVRPAVKKETLKAVLDRWPEITRSFTNDQWQLLRSSYRPYFDISEFVPLAPDNVSQRAYRFMTRFRAILRSDSKMVLGEIFDVSSSGVFFKTSEEDLDIGSTIHLYFQMEGQTWSLPMTVRRKQAPLMNRYPGGYGLQLGSADTRLDQLLRRAESQVQQLEEILET